MAPGPRRRVRSRRIAVFVMVATLVITVAVVAVIVMAAMRVVAVVLASSAPSALSARGAVPALAPLGGTLGVLGPFEGSAESHQSRHREHVDQSIERLIVGVAKAHRNGVAHLAGPPLAPGSSPVGVVVVLLRSWHVVVTSSRGSSRSLTHERYL
jgi:hypothetical protein